MLNSIHHSYKRSSAMSSTLRGARLLLAVRTAALAIAVFGITVTVTGSAQAQESIEKPPVSLERARGAQLAAASGHYARSRKYLQMALEEFDRGRRKADPSSLLNVDRFRSNLISSAEALETVLDPQPRASETGVRFEAEGSTMGVN